MQTIFRAGLYAVIRALHATRGPLEVVSDCAGVVSSGSRYLRGKAVSPKAAHADLWRELKRAADDREVTLRWVPSHRPEQAVWGGHISPEDWRGNRLADKAANKAMQLHPDP